MMDLIQQLHTWSKGDILQGRWMIAIALVILLPTCILLMKSDNDIQRGIVIPFCLLLAMNVGYGGYLLWSKPKHTEQTKKQFQLNPNEVLKYEIVKISADDKSYLFTRYAWISLITISVIVYSIVTKDYYRG